MIAGESIPVLNQAEDARLIEALNKMSNVQKWTIKSNRIICEKINAESK